MDGWMDISTPSNSQQLPGMKLSNLSAHLFYFSLVSSIRRCAIFLKRERERAQMMNALRKKIAMATSPKKEKRDEPLR